VAIDGFAVLTWQPFDYEAVYKTDYCYNKGVFVIFFNVGYDVDCHFIVASCKHSGSNNDIIASQHMNLYDAVEIDN
jgi:hypothetical protein